jgi:hypothetical protein
MLAGIKAALATKSFGICHRAIATACCFPRHDRGLSDRVETREEAGRDPDAEVSSCRRPIQAHVIPTIRVPLCSLRARQAADRSA